MHCCLVQGRSHNAVNTTFSRQSASRGDEAHGSVSGVGMQLAQRYVVQRRACLHHLDQAGLVANLLWPIHNTHGTFVTTQGLHGLAQGSGISDHKKSRTLTQLVMTQQHLGRDFRPDTRHVSEGDCQRGNGRCLFAIKRAHTENLRSRTAFTALINTSGEPKPPALVTTGKPATGPPVRVPSGIPPVTSSTNAIPPAPRASSTALAPSPPVATTPA